MNRFLVAVLWAALCALVSFAANSQSTIEQLAPVPIFPLPDSATTTHQHLWITQGCATPAACDYKITPEQGGAIHQGTTAPVNPFANQLWFDTSQSPAVLRQWNGANWGSLGGVGLINVSAFGVLGDGSDQTINLTSAINATAGHGCLFFPSPTVGYAIHTPSAPIILPSGTCMEGTGGGSRIFALSGSGPMFQTASGGILRMSDLAIDGNRGGGATGTCIQTDPTVGSQGMELDRVTFINCAQSPLLLSGTATPSANIQVHNSFFANNYSGPTATSLTQFNFDNSLIQNNDWWGIGCLSLVELGTQAGLNTGGCTQGTIVGNILTANGCVGRADNIQSILPGNSDITIANNISKNSCAQGIHWGGQRITYTGNHVINNANEGILTQTVNFYNGGTATVANGSTAVTGIGTSWSSVCQDIESGFTSEDGTRFQTAVTGGNTVIGGGNVPGVLIKSINNDTSITLSTAWTGSSQTIPYSIWCPVPAVDNIIIGNTVANAPNGYADIYVGRPTGGSVTANVSDDNSGAYGILVVGANQLAITGNTMSGKANSPIRIDSDSQYSTGTVQVSNGGTTVTLTGGSFDGTPNLKLFRATADSPMKVYDVTAQTSTTLTLLETYTGTGGSGLAYVVAGGLSSSVSMTGNSTLNSGGPGVTLNNTYNSVVSGGTIGTGNGAVTESGTAYGNFMTGFLGNNVVTAGGSVALHLLSNNGNPGVALNNLLTTPGSKQKLCIDAATGYLFISNAGNC